jgi:excisionase family DNA binding protein
MPKRDVWLTTEDVAMLWVSSRKTVLRRIRDGVLPASKVPGGREWRVTLQDAQDALTPPEGTPVVRPPGGDVPEG